MIYGALSAVSLAVAILFTAQGAWYVLGFALVELAVLGLAFLHYGRHATDCEHIKFVDGYLYVELVQADKMRQFRLDSRYTRVEPPRVRSELISLADRFTQVRVGRFLPDVKRREFAQELWHSLVSCGK